MVAESPAACTRCSGASPPHRGEVREAGGTSEPGSFRGISGPPEPQASKSLLRRSNYENKQPEGSGPFLSINWDGCTI